MRKQAHGLQPTDPSTMIVRQSIFNVERNLTASREKSIKLYQYNDSIKIQAEKEPQGSTLKIYRTCSFVNWYQEQVLYKLAEIGNVLGFVYVCDVKNIRIPLVLKAIQLWTFNTKTSSIAPDETFIFRSACIIPRSAKHLRLLFENMNKQQLRLLYDDNNK